jgi:RNA-directed DNA polymerase
MQALHLQALVPVAEFCADRNSYGFRPERCAADAIEQCFRALSHKTCAQYILEGDIKKCFDRLSHKWLETHIPMDTRILHQWLEAGYMEERVLYPTKQGAAQGGVASPTIAVIALSGLEKAVKAVTSIRDKVHVVVYADDFIVTAASKEVLEQKVKPAIIAFLQERGLELSETKTKITHIDEGFDFLGHQIRKYQGKLLIKPSKIRTKAFLDEVCRWIKKFRGRKTVELIRLLNPKIRGWANYYRHVVSKKTFSHVDDCIYRAIARWIKWRHPEKNAKWWRENYFRCQGMRNWVLTAEEKIGKEKRRFDLLKVAYMPIRRHLKIIAEATPFDLDWLEYFERRKQHKIRENIILRSMFRSRAGKDRKTNQPNSRVGTTNLPKCPSAVRGN